MTLLSGIFIQYLAPIFYQRVGDGTDSKRVSAVDEIKWESMLSVSLSRL